MLFWYGHVISHEVSDLIMSFRVTSLALGQSYDCPSASEVTLKDMGVIASTKP